MGAPSKSSGTPAPPKGRSLWSDALRRLRKNRLAIISGFFLVFIAAVGFGADLIAEHVTHFSQEEQHQVLKTSAPGVKAVSKSFPTYNGDKAGFAVIDFDGDGFITCERVPQPDVLPPGFRQLQDWSPELHADAVATYDALDAQIGVRDIIARVNGELRCPELALAHFVADQWYDSLFPTWDTAGGDGDGYLTWEEFPKDDTELDKRFRDLGLSGPDAFRALDVNQDDIISLWEVVEQSRYLRYASSSGRGESFDHFIIEHDADRDLRLSLAEYPGAPVLHTFHMGVDEAGRDVMTRLAYGARLSLKVAIFATLVSLLIGVIYGSVAGYFGGRVDNIMMRIVDVLYGLPFMFLVILLLVIAGRSTIVLFIALGAVQWLTMARVVRGQVISLKTREFVEAARAVGVSKTSIVFRHLIRNAVGPVVVYSTLLVPRVILEEAFLSFLGLTTELSWGIMIAEGARHLNTFPWLIVFPGIALGLTLFAMNFLGDGVRDAIDPKQS